MRKRTTKTTNIKRRKPAVQHLAPPDNTQPVLSPEGPRFAQPKVTPDPSKFSRVHASDKQAYGILDAEKDKLLPRTFPVVDATEPVLTLEKALGAGGGTKIATIEEYGQIVFHALGDTGNTRSAHAENEVTDKLVSDFQDEAPEAVPAFCYNLGDVVYSFGESEYYYDQFYEPYRDYPAPIFAIAGNHDGMVSPLTPNAKSLDAFTRNFCAADQPSHIAPEALNLVRTAGIQPAVYFTLEAPFVRILGLYSNCLEDPGVISSQAGSSPVYQGMPDAQLDFLRAALGRVKSERFDGAVIIAVHHPPYVAITDTAKTGGKHGNSPIMLAEIDAACRDSGVWPHAILSGHAHNYQRFTRELDGRETPCVVCGNGGHAHNPLTRKGEPTIRTPMPQPYLSNGRDKVTFERYDDANYGYLRIIGGKTSLRIEYHPASDGANQKTPDDSVTVDLKTRKITR